MNRMRIALLATLLVLAGTFGWLAYMRGSVVQKPSQVVHIATFSTAIDYAPFYVARRRKLFDQALAPFNLQPSYTTFESLPPLNDSVRAGQLDLVFEAEPPALIAEAAGTDVFVPIVSAVLRQQIIVRKGSGIDRMSDLSGRSVGVLTGTSSHYGLIEALRRANVPVDKVSIVNLAPAEARAAFESGRIDAWAIWPPFPEVEIEDGRAIALPNSGAPIVSMAVLRGGFARQNPTVVKAIDGALEKAKAFIQSHPDEAMRIVAEAVNQPLAVVRRAWPQHDFGAGVTAGIEDQVQRTADFLEQGKYLPRHVDVKVELFHEE